MYYNEYDDSPTDRLLKQRKKRKLKTRVKIIIGINSDIRLQSANKYDVPTYGMNHYVLGAILSHGYFVRSFDEAVEKLKECLK